MSREVVVIGGGASGMMAAIWAAREGAKVTLLEAGEKLGKKLSITGNGRCNFSAVRGGEEAYRGEEPLFAQAVLSSFTVQDTVSFFTRLGIYSENIGGGLYPRSMQAQSMVTALERELSRLSVKKKCKERVTEILSLGEEKDLRFHGEDDKRFHGEKDQRIEEEKAGHPFLVKTETWQYPADAVILAAGSPAHAETGATGDGYAFASRLGHRVIPPYPALTSLVCKQAPSFGWAGVRCKGRVSAYAGEEFLSSDEGELQLTEYGVSGIPVFNISSPSIRALEEGKETVRVVLDFFPEVKKEDFASFWEARKKLCPHLSGKDLLFGLFPDKLSAALWKMSGGKEEALLSCLKELSLTASGYQRERAQVYSGGVSTEEVDFHTLQSVLVPGLYLCGEVLDVDGKCGGYNLQWAWSSGQVAGFHAGGAMFCPRSRRGEAGGQASGPDQSSKNFVFRGGER